MVSSLEYMGNEFETFDDLQTWVRLTRIGESRAVLQVSNPNDPFHKKKPLIKYRR